MKKKSQSSNKKELMNEPLEISVASTFPDRCWKSGANHPGVQQFPEAAPQRRPISHNENNCRSLQHGDDALWTRAPLSQVEGLCREIIAQEVKLQCSIVLVKQSLTQYEVRSVSQWFFPSGKPHAKRTDRFSVRWP